MQGWTELGCIVMRMRLLSFQPFLTLGCQKQVWTVRLRIWHEIGNLEKLKNEICAIWSVGVLCTFSASQALQDASLICWADLRSWLTHSASWYPAGVPTPLQMRGISIIFFFSSPLSLSNYFLVRFVGLLCTDCGKWKRRHERCETVISSIDKSIQEDLMCAACV